MDHDTTHALRVLGGEKGVSSTLGTSTPGTADLVHVVFDVGRHIVVDDVANVLDICAQ